MTKTLHGVKTYPNQMATNQLCRPIPTENPPMNTPSRTQEVIHLSIPRPARQPEYIYGHPTHHDKTGRAWVALIDKATQKRTGVVRLMSRAECRRAKVLASGGGAG